MDNACVIPTGYKKEEIINNLITSKDKACLIH